MSITSPCVLSTLDLSGAPKAIETLETCSSLTCVEPVRTKVLPLLHDVDVYFASAAVEVDVEFLDAAPHLRLVASPSTGTDHLDLEEMKKRKITVFDIAKEYELLEQFTATSELTFGLILNLVRNIIPANSSAKNAIWAREKFSGFQLHGKIMGVLGLGRLGKITAKIAQGFGMHVIAYDPKKPIVEGVNNVEFEELFRKSDIISIHIHLNKETDGLINTKVFKIMKKTSILINTSRGKIIDENALLKALTNNQIAGVGLDVIDGEWLSEDELARHPIIEYSNHNNNLLIVPHIGGSTWESINLARIFMANKISNFLHLEQRTLIKNSNH